MNPDQTYLILLVYHLIIYTCLKHISRASARLTFFKCYFKYDFCLCLYLCQYQLGNWRNGDRCERIYKKDSYYVDIDIMRDRRNLHKNIVSLPPRSFLEVKDIYYTPTLQWSAHTSMGADIRAKFTLKYYYKGKMYILKKVTILVSFQV